MIKMEALSGFIMTLRKFHILNKVIESKYELKDEDVYVVYFISEYQPH